MLSVSEAKRRDVSQLHHAWFGEGRKVVRSSTRFFSCPHPSERQLGAPDKLSLQLVRLRGRRGPARGSGAAVRVPPPHRAALPRAGRVLTQQKLPAGPHGEEEEEVEEEEGAAALPRSLRASASPRREGRGRGRGGEGGEVG